MVGVTECARRIGGYLYKIDSDKFRSIYRWPSKTHFLESSVRPIDPDERIVKAIAKCLIAEECADSVCGKSYFSESDLSLELFYDLQWHRVGWPDMIHISDSELLPFKEGQSYAYLRCGAITADAIEKIQEAFASDVPVHFRSREETLSIGTQLAFKLIELYRCNAMSKEGLSLGPKWMLFGESDLIIADE